MRKFILALLLTAPIPAQAAIIQVDITGNLFQVSNSVASQFALGDAVTAQFVLDTDAVGDVYSAEASFFADAVISGFITVNGYTATFGSDARAFVTDDEYAGAMDRFLIDDYSSPAAAVNGMSFSDLFLDWEDGSATASQGFTLPDTQARFLAYGLPSGGIDWLTSDGQNRISFRADQIVVTNITVPEPATWAMMIGGFAFAGATMRRRKVVTTFA